MSTYTLRELRQEAASLRRRVRESVREQGYEPKFEADFELTIGNASHVCLTVAYKMGGVRQVSSMAI